LTLPDETIEESVKSSMEKNFREADTCLTCRHLRLITDYRIQEYCIKHPKFKIRGNTICDDHAR